MRVLVTGGTGSVGANVVRRLALEGHEVICLARWAEEPDPVLARFLAPVRERVRLAAADVGDWQQVAGVFEQHRPTHVVHAAAITPTPEMERDHSRTVVNVNLMGTVNVLEAARQTGVRRIAYISSAAVYAETPEDAAITEDHPTRPWGLYAICKDASERLCAYYNELHGLETVALRVGWVYGPMERTMKHSRHNLSIVQQAVDLALRGEEIRVLHLEPVRDWIHADDLGRAVLILLEQPQLRSTVYNLSGGRGISHRELLDTLARVLPLRYRQVDNETETNIPPGATRPRRGPAGIMRLQGDTGYEPVFDLEAGLRDYVSWVRQEAAAGSSD